MNLFSSSTPLDPQVEAATAETLKLPDIGINMEICDNINRDRAGGANILKSIKRRLQSKSTRTVMLTLDLLEMCVKNCHRGFHAELAKKDNLDAVVEVATKKNQQLDIRDKALLLIMSWAEAFHKQQEFPTYWDTYQKLLQKGVIFPARDLSTLAPVFTPPAHTQPKPAAPSNTINIPSSSQQQRPVNGKHPFSWLSPEFVVKTKTELQVVVNYVRVFRDMLTASPHSGPQLSTDEALLSLSRTLSEIRTRLANLIVGVMEHEELLDLSIQMNEQVRICLEWYQARVTNAHYTPAPLMIPPALAALDPSNRSTEQKGERDEKDDFASLAQREQKSDDSFAALARSRMETPKHQHPQGERSPAAAVSSSSSSSSATQDLLPSLDAITLQFDPVVQKQTSPQQPISFDPFAPVSQQPTSTPVPAPVPAAAPAAGPADSSFFDFINATSSPDSLNPNPNLTSPLSSPDSVNDFIEISDQMNKTTISNNNNASSGSGGPSLI